MAAVWLCGLASVVPAAELAEVLACRELVWAADQEGGGPHVFPDPKNPEQVKGFEVDLAAMIDIWHDLSPGVEAFEDPNVL